MFKYILLSFLALCIPFKSYAVTDLTTDPTYKMVLYDATNNFVAIDSQDDQKRIISIDNRFGGHTVFKCDLDTKTNCKDNNGRSIEVKYKYINEYIVDVVIYPTNNPRNILYSGMTFQN